MLSRESVEVGLESEGNQDLVAFQVAQAVGPAVKLPNLEAQGLKFMRAQLLHFDDKPLAQMLYLAVHKDPLALYAMRGGGGDSKPVFKQEGAIGTVSWRDDGISYLLAGEDDEAALVRLAEKIRNEPSALLILIGLPLSISTRTLATLSFVPAYCGMASVPWARPFISRSDMRWRPTSAKR